ncbi:MAG: exopolysaccharide transport family protein [Yoonia sp.]|uniref:exopolysaccharide transport family protein n=1 Tax=Yoonia sp. TaxID=2212373 RepID=UPI003EF2402D
MNTQTYEYPLSEGELTQVAPLDVGGLLRVVWHGKWTLVLCTLLMMVAGGYYAFHISGTRFSSTAVLQVDVQSPQLGDVSRQWPAPATDAASLNTEVALLTSDPVLQQVIDRLDLHSDPEFNRYLTPLSPFAPNAIRGRLRQLLAGTQDTPPDASAMAQKTVENLRAHLSATRPDDTYIFRISAQSRDPDKAALIANTAAAAYIAAKVNAQQVTAESAITWLQERVATLRQRLEAQEQEVATLIARAQLQQGAGLDVLSNAVLAAEDERASLMVALATVNGQSTDSVRAAAQVAQLREQIAATDARRARLQTQLQQQSDGLITLQQYQREAEATRVLYQSFLTRLQETQVQQGLTYPGSRIVTPASGAVFAGPRKTVIVFASAILGVFLGLAFITARHMAQRGALHPAELRHHTGRTVFATLTQRATGNPARFLRKVARGDVPQVQRIKASLMIEINGVLPQIIVMTSTTSHEACAAIACATAQTIAGGGKPVLLMQADPDTSEAGRYFQQIKQGATETLICKTLPRVHAIMDADFAKQLAQWRCDFAHIVVIAPPVLGTPETLLLAGYADSMVMAVRWAKTPYDAINRALGLLQKHGTAPVGLVLTKTNPRKMRGFAAVSGSSTARYELA